MCSVNQPLVLLVDRRRQLMVCESPANNGGVTRVGHGCVTRVGDGKEHLNLTWHVLLEIMNEHGQDLWF